MTAQEESGGKAPNTLGPQRSPPAYPVSHLGISS